MRERTPVEARPAPAPIVLVDDAPGLRKLMRFHLEEVGYQVDEVADGATALARLRSSPRALILVMNTRVPILSAADMLRVVAGDEALQRHGFVLVTALARMLPDELWELTHQLGIPVVAKPFTAQDLLDSVAAAEHHSVQPARRHTTPHDATRRHTTPHDATRRHTTPHDAILGHDTPPPSLPPPPPPPLQPPRPPGQRSHGPSTRTRLRAWFLRLRLRLRLSPHW